MAIASSFHCGRTFPAPNEYIRFPLECFHDLIVDLQRLDAGKSSFSRSWRSGTISCANVQRNGDNCRECTGLP